MDVAKADVAVLGVEMDAAIAVVAVQRVAVIVGAGKHKVGVAEVGFSGVVVTEFHVPGEELAAACTGASV